MRKNGLTFSAGLFLLAAGLAFGQLQFVADLTGLNEVPPNNSTASGTVTLWLNAAQDRLTMHITLFGLDLDGNQTHDPLDNVMGLHIHAGSAGVNGPVVFGLIGINNDLNNDLTIDAPAGTVFSAWDLSEGANTTLADQLGNLLAGNLYINVHTAAYPGGEIRGQILLVPEPASLALTLAGTVAVYQMRTRRRRE